MTPTETVCLSCGSVLEQVTTKDRMGGGFRFILSVLFFASAALTVASLFFEFTPPFTRCAVATVVLLIVRTSAGEMVERKKSR